MILALNHLQQLNGNNMIKGFGLILVFFLTTLSFAQPDKAEVETIDGKTTITIVADSVDDIS